MPIAASTIRSFADPKQSVKSFELGSGSIFHILWDEETRSLTGQAYDASGAALGTAAAFFTNLPEKQTLGDVVQLENGNYLFSFSDAVKSDLGYEFTKHTVITDSDGTIISDTDIGSVYEADRSTTVLHSLADGGVVEITVATGDSTIATQTVYDNAGVAILENVPIVGAGSIVNGGVSFLALDDGRYVMATTVQDDDILPDGLYVQVYNADGSEDGTVTFLDSGTANSYFPEQLVELADGGFALNTTISSATDRDVYEYIFDASGALTTTIENPHFNNVGQGEPRTTQLADDSLVTTWIEQGQIYFQHHDSSGVEISAVKKLGKFEVHSLSICGLSDGKFVILWEFEGSGYQQVFNADGTAASKEVRINELEGDSGIAGVTAGNDGSWTVVAENGLRRTFNLDSADHAPIALDNELTADEDQSLSFYRSSFLTYDSDGDSVEAIQITGVVGEGTLTYQGIAVTDGQSIEFDELEDLIWTPDKDANGDDVGQIYYKAVDSNGVASDTAGTLSINVEPVDDRPEGQAFERSVYENGSYRFKLEDFAFTDVDGDSLRYIYIFDKDHGKLYKGDQVFNGRRIEVADIAQYEWRPDAGFSGDDKLAFNFKLQDTGSSSGFAENQSKTYQFRVDVLDVTDAPEGKDMRLEMKEDTVFQFSPDLFSIKDADGDKLKSIIIDSLPEQGELTLNGKNVKVGQEIAASDLKQLLFTPDKDVIGFDIGDFRFRVRDDGGTAHGGLDTAEKSNKISFRISDERDTILGTKNDDKIKLDNGPYDADGLGGDDKITGNYSRNIIHGGDGDDVINGDGGKDLIFGEDGDDEIYAHTGTANGGAGNDRLWAVHMTGGTGKDLFIADGYSWQSVKDFHAEGADHDKAHIGWMTGIDKFSDLNDSNFYQAKGDTVIRTFDGSYYDYFVLEGVDKKDLTADHFQF